MRTNPRAAWRPRLGTGMMMYVPCLGHAGHAAGQIATQEREDGGKTPGAWDRMWTAVALNDGEPDGYGRGSVCEKIWEGKLEETHPSRERPLCWSWRIPCCKARDKVVRVSTMTKGSMIEEIKSPSHKIVTLPGVLHIWEALGRRRQQRFFLVQFVLFSLPYSTNLEQSSCTFD
jgi:hypothetical protein